MPTTSRRTRKATTAPATPADTEPTTTATDPAPADTEPATATDPAPATATDPAPATDPRADGPVSGRPASGAPGAAPPGQKTEGRCTLGKNDRLPFVQDSRAAHPGREFTPSTLSREMGRWSGAMGNALDKPVISGEATLAKEAPRIYMAPAGTAT